MGQVESIGGCGIHGFPDKAEGTGLCETCENA